MLALTPITWKTCGCDCLNVLVHSFIPSFSGNEAAPQSVSRWQHKLGSWLCQPCFLKIWLSDTLNNKHSSFVGLKFVCTRMRFTHLMTSISVRYSLKTEMILLQHLLQYLLHDSLLEAQCVTFTGVCTQKGKVPLWLYSSLEQGPSQDLRFNWSQLVQKRWVWCKTSSLKII